MKKTVFLGLSVALLIFGFIGCDNGNLSGTTTYSVSFNSNGGSDVQAITGITSGATITLPTNPTKAGFIFSGWFVDNEIFQNQFTAYSIIISDLTVYAKWLQDIFGVWKTANFYIAINDDGTWSSDIDGLSGIYTLNSDGKSAILTWNDQVVGNVALNADGTLTVIIGAFHDVFSRVKNGNGNN